MRGCVHWGEGGVSLMEDMDCGIFCVLDNSNTCTIFCSSPNFPRKFFVIRKVDIVEVVEVVKGCTSIGSLYFPLSSAFRAAAFVIPFRGNNATWLRPAFL